MDADPAFGSITELAPRLASGELSPVDLTETILARIEKRDDRLNAYITVTADEARKAAHEAEAAIKAGNYIGPLHGIPVAVKDLFATQGVRTTVGSLLFDDWVPAHDAAVVERLKDAGAIIVGKTNMQELAYGTKSDNPHYGPVCNPWDTACHPGGSSGGSAAALAAGMAVVALGSDTGASIRQPAACCGVVGLKPTYGRVSKWGAVPLAWSMDHAGPMARCVGDTAIMLRVLAGHDDRDPTSVRRPVPDYPAAIEAGIEGSRIGVARAYFFDDCDPEVEACMEAALGVFRDLGASVEDIDLADMRTGRAASSVIISAEASAYFGAAVRRRPDAVSDAVRESLELGRFYTTEQYLLAQRFRRYQTTEINRILAGFDVLVMPTSAIPAGPIDKDPRGHGLLRWRNCEPFNLTGLPAISVPCGFTAAGLPVGLQIVGKAFDEAGIMKVAHAYEQATPWHRQRPPV